MEPKMDDLTVQSLSKKKRRWLFKWSAISRSESFLDIPLP